jgi:Protein of unknown function (DUF3826)
MKGCLLIFIVFFLNTSAVVAQQVTGQNDQETAYNQAIQTRAEKIVASLGISDSAKFTSVTNLIAAQYKNLNTIYSERDLQVKLAKAAQADSNHALTKVRLDEIKEATTLKVDALHKIYISHLSQRLTDQQIDRVKDGMTYNVVNVTYRGYNQMIQTLTEPQKKQIMEWLIEAREHAMDAESSEKKHGWFGKYKGRINNYLSSAGFDLKKAGDEWAERIKAEKTK